MRVPILIMLVASACAYDPAPGLGRGRIEARQFECVRVTHVEASRRFPGALPPEAPRTLADVRTDALVCEPRFLSLTERMPRDEAILSTLRSQVDSLTTLASKLNPGEVTWYVDAFYPEQAVASKISGAARVALFEGGRKVSDRVPTLAAGDVAVLSRMAPAKSYALACSRYFAEAILREREVFLGLMIIDPRETSLHAGVCDRGEWRWLE